MYCSEERYSIERVNNMLDLMKYKEIKPTSLSIALHEDIAI